MNAVGGTALDTGAAVGALAVVDDSVEILHMNCVVFTGLFALFAADTAGFAGCHGSFAV